MKTIYLITIAFMICACTNKENIRIINISESKAEPVSSTIWQKADSNRFYYDLRIAGPYYIFLDENNDTIIRIYKQDNPSVLYNYHVRKEKSLLDNKLYFLKTNTRYETKENQVWLVENKNAIKTLNIENPTGQILSSAIGFPFFNLPNSTDYNITTDEIYAAPLNYDYNAPFFFYRPDSGYVRAQIHEHPGVDYPKAGLAYLTNLIVNEEKKSIVSAQRFMNEVLFYDLKGNIRTVATLSDNHILPEIKDKQVDMKNSTKCFIYICGTKKHVYCLYDGTTDYTALSKILVFDWNGKHLKTYQTDRCLKQIAINENETEIVALAANQQSGRDVVRYKIK